MLRADINLIGWQAQVVFPKWKKSKMRAKIDTGARSSAIHAEEYEIKKTSSSRHVEFNEEMRMKIRVGSKRIWVTAPVVDYRSVKNSSGKAERRPFIKTQIEILGEVYPIILSVTNREKMRFPVLLGRTFLSGKFLIDPSVPAVRSSQIDE